LVVAALLAVGCREQAHGLSKGDIAVVDMELVPTDHENNACASAEEVAGKRCGFELERKPRTGVEAGSLLRPYTTAPPLHIQFLAAGIWDDPAMAPNKLPATRFVVKCKLRVDGAVKKLSVRWETGGQWYPQEDWPAGVLSGCQLWP
jgi:hypothetical protein